MIFVPRDSLMDVLALGFAGTLFVCGGVSVFDTCDGMSKFVLMI